jgi:ketosteroid isomerase-like protein
MRRLLVIVLLSACASAPHSDGKADEQAGEQANVNRVLDAWHRAAATADEPAYFGAVAPEFVFLGTDSSERWDLNSFRAFSHPYFAAGKAWTFVPHDRHVILSPAGDVAWFDEKLDSASYGDCRGSGVLRRVNGEWKIAHYNLTIPIPNDLAKTVVGMIRESVHR